MVSVGEKNADGDGAVNTNKATDLGDEHTGSPNQPSTMPFGSSHTPVVTSNVEGTQSTPITTTRLPTIELPHTIGVYLRNHLSPMLQSHFVCQ